MFGYYQEKYKGYSPWGGIQYSKVIVRGLKAVSTAGHGGYMVTEKFAEKYLSEACKKRALTYSNYLCFEEDCDWAILAFDVLEDFGDKMKSEETTLEAYRNSLLETVSLYNADYLLEIGVEPSPYEYAIYLKRKKEDEMRGNQHPDLIVSALSMGDNVVRVYTADRKEHYVTKDSYSVLRENGDMLLLSKCDKVEYKEAV
ncbi:DUF7007 domain-containing protein [Clostridium disporicum]|mgnify:CR=1 FL=1|uniref:DUF7007 domain-containing protein n=1 Tax=Clostridium disporicum TaxID=84024 RepID=UPI0034A440CC